jgi:hypothetical protein
LRIRRDVSSKDKLLPVIDTLISAIRAGELDFQAAKTGSIGKARKGCLIISRPGTGKLAIRPILYTG